MRTLSCAGRVRIGKHIQNRKTLALAAAFKLYPDGLVFSQETKFFEPRNTLLMNSVEEMFTALEAEFNFGVPDGI